MQVLAKVVMPTSTGLPEDDVTNDFVIEYVPGDPDLTALNLATTNLADFYNSAAGGATENVGYYLSGTISRTASACSVRYYDLGDPITTPLGSPIHVGTWTFAETAPAAGEDYPNEVAICLSTQALLPAGATHPGRYRGRVFLGPLARRSSDLTSLIPRVSTACRTDICLSAEKLANDMIADAWLWKIWSRADNALHTIVGGWVDNAFDIQRRRGVAATTRTTWAA